MNGMEDSISRLSPENNQFRLFEVLMLMKREKSMETAGRREEGKKGRRVNKQNGRKRGNRNATSSRIATAKQRSNEEATRKQRNQDAL